MRKFRFVYWLGSMTTECYVSGHDEREAEDNFRKTHGDMQIFSVEEV